MKGKTTIEFKGFDKNAVEFHGHLKVPHTRKSKIEREFERIFPIKISDCLAFTYESVKFYYKEPYSFHFTKPNDKWQRDPEPSTKSFPLFPKLLAFLKTLCLKIKGKSN